MKLAMAVSTPEVKQNPIGITGKDGTSIFRACKDLGYHGIELMPQRPSEVKIGPLAETLAKLELEVPVIGTGLIYAHDRLTLLSLDGEERAEALKRVKICIDWASDLGAMVSLGGVRGKLPSFDSKGLAMAQLVFEDLCSYACSRQVKLVLEPINRYENNFLNTAQEALFFLDKIDSSGCGILLDLFHVNFEEASFEQAILETANRLWHIHISDSNRWPPGYGHTNFSAIIKVLKLAGYRGYLSAELLPRPSETVAMTQTAQTILPIINSVSCGRELPSYLTDWCSE